MVSDDHRYTAAFAAKTLTVLPIEVGFLTVAILLILMRIIIFTKRLVV